MERDPKGEFGHDYVSVDTSAIIGVNRLSLVSIGPWQLTASVKFGWRGPQKSLNAGHARDRSQDRVGGV
jgi:hypothetical protein